MQDSRCKIPLPPPKATVGGLDDSEGFVARDARRREMARQSALDRGVSRAAAEARRASSLEREARRRRSAVKVEAATHAEVRQSRAGAIAPNLGLCVRSEGAARRGRPLGHLDDDAPERACAEVRGSARSKRKKERGSVRPPTQIFRRRSSTASLGMTGRPASAVKPHSGRPSRHGDRGGHGRGTFGTRAIGSGIGIGMGIGKDLGWATGTMR